MRFKLKSSNIFPMPGNKHMLHLATIEYGLREFVVMLFPREAACYIEEVVLNNISWTEDVTASCKFIQDDDLAADLAAFAEENEITDMHRRVSEIIAAGNSDWLV